ncbi:transposon Ty3-G Gag-Pol polyprotein [Elysia marginata]|uniref:Transposon Ty3-G Gag-Pol polyprotein n=1 Tax=Elysia marginata TaxID=1093978 RepID=A0AAV4JF93_9GAST|nr:transposon Ty3-G Gag-Pol polyprotein [Elysia marginata]
MNIEADDRKKALLIHYGGEEIFDLVDTLPDVQKSNFDALKTALTNHVTPKVNLVYESLKFRKMHQEQVESVDQFHVRLRRQAALCEFADLEREILSQMIEGVVSSNLRKKALRNKVTLHQFLQEARNEGLTNKQVGEIEREVGQAAAISRKPRHLKIEGSQSQAGASFQPKHKGTYKQVAQKHRRIPYHIRKDTEAELKRLEEQDIIENVEGPTPWVSPIVVIPKKTGGVRLCVDMRRANEAIKRERHPMPTLEEVINELNGSKFFSRLDLKQAFHQIELSEESRHITTFATHVGLRRYKRLMFGINAASELFQHHLNQILHDIQGATNYIDDVIIFGKTREEHDRNLQAALDRLQERGVKLNKDKCLFGAQKVTFLGHVFGEYGIHLEPQKIKCVSEATAPTNIAAVRSFLGMTQYVSRFIRGYATITEPLRMLTKKTQPWTWGKPQQDAFDQLKSALTNAGVMSYFDPSKPTEIIVDASPCGLGAILTQKGHVICYGSRALTQVESRYSQTEREMLAVVYRVEKFHMYLYGSKFTVTTDHKPLLGIMNNSKPCSTRFERWRLRLIQPQIQPWQR